MAVRSGQKERLDEIDKRLDELRKRYDLYFQGSPEQRTPPAMTQAQLGGELRRIREEETRTWNTQDKFRFAQIFARYVSLDRMWARTMKQIEDGTHKRGKLKVKLKQGAGGNSETGAPTDTQVGSRPDISDFDVDVGSFDDDVITSQPPTKPVERTQQTKAVPPPISGIGKSEAPRPQNGSPSQGVSEQRLKQLYDVYMQAKKRTGESSSLTMDALKKQIEKQIPAIKAKHKCDNVDFKVVLKDGKAMLKAVPK